MHDAHHILCHNIAYTQKAASSAWQTRATHCAWTPTWMLLQVFRCHACFRPRAGRLHMPRSSDCRRPSFGKGPLLMQRASPTISVTTKGKATLEEWASADFPPARTCTCIRHRTAYPPSQATPAAVRIHRHAGSGIGSAKNHSKYQPKWCGRETHSNIKVPEPRNTSAKRTPPRRHTQHHSDTATQTKLWRHSDGPRACNAVNQ